MPPSSVVAVDTTILAHRDAVDEGRHPPHLECIQFVRRTAVQTAVHVITTGILIALLTGIAMKLRWFEPNP